MPSICFSGTFSRREDKAIIQHSGLICLDFDNYDTEDELVADKDGQVRLEAQWDAQRVAPLQEFSAVNRLVDIVLVDRIGVTGVA